MPDPDPTDPASRTRLDERTPAGPWAPVVLAALTVSSVLAIAHRGSIAVRWAWLVVALLLHGLLIALLRRGHRLRLLPVGAAIALVLFAGVAEPPHRSADVWAYASYGRMQVHYHLDPYVHRPSEIPKDVLVRRMDRGWRGARQVYGPAFSALTLVGAHLYGDSPGRARVWFQGLAALAAAMGAALLWRMTRQVASVCIFGLSPLVTVVITHEAHTDVLIGVLVLASLATIGRRRGSTTAAMVPLALAVLVKLVIGIVAIPLFAWIWVHRGVRDAVRSGALLGALVLAGYAPFGMLRAVRPTLDASYLQSSMTAWRLFADGGTLPHWTRVASVLLVVLVVASIAVARAHDREPVLGMVAAMMAYVLGASYVVPWYYGAVLPIAALGWRSRISSSATVLAGVFAVLYGTGSRLPWGPVDSLRRRISTGPWPLLELLAFVGLGIVSTRMIALQLRRTSTTHPG